MIGRTSREVLKGLAIFTGVLMLLVLIAAPIVFLRNFKVYEDPKHRVRIRYPSDWEEQHPMVDGTIVVFMGPREDSLEELIANVGITYTDFSQQPMTPKEYADLAVRQMTGVFQDITAEPPWQVRISGHPGYKLVFHSRDAPKITFVFYAFLFNDTGYNITYVGETERYQRIDKYIVEVMIRSLKFGF